MFTHSAYAPARHCDRGTAAHDVPPELAVVVDALIATLASTWPLTDGSPDNRLAAARAALEALRANDLAEIMVASRMIAAHHASMDSYRRSLRPGLCDADVTRLRANAVATGRAADAGQRTLDRHRAPLTKPAAVPPAWAIRGLICTICSARGRCWGPYSSRRIICIIISS